MNLSDFQIGNIWALALSLQGLSLMMSNEHPLPFLAACVRCLFVFSLNKESSSLIIHLLKLYTHILQLWLSYKNCIFLLAFLFVFNTTSAGPPAEGSG